jgi:DNA-binding CsgD family transcriptional regulator
MALTSNDETDLLLPLFGGLEEKPPFATFLARLRRRTGAELVDLVIENEPEGSAGKTLLPIQPALRSALRPFRTYTLAELEIDTNEYADARIVMFPLPDGSRGWLVLARARPCSAADSALLSNLVPYVRSVVATGRQILREQAASTLDAEALERTGSGWALLDADLRLLAIEHRTRHRLAALSGSPPVLGERLRGIDIGAERQLAQASRSDGAARTVILLNEPRVEAVLETVASGSALTRAYPTAALIAWCRFEIPDKPQRIDAFASLRDLPRREAELAIAMADGLSIAEAGEQMGLTLETARNYSKQLYAKLGVRGQGQLVRLVQQSGAMLA